MALFTSYSDANRTPYNGPDVRYQVVPFFYGATSANGEYQVPLYWTITRTSSRSYRYLGMTHEAAIACANDLRAKHTRSYAAWTAKTASNGSGNVPNVYISQNYVIKCSTSISISNTAGSNYAVDVGETDTDTVISTTELKSDSEFAAIFQLAEARTSSVGAIAVTAAKWRSDNDSVTVDYEAFFANFDKSKVTVQVKSGDLWVSASVSSRPTDSRLVFYSEANCTFRLVYDAASASPTYSKEWKTNDLAVPSLVISAAESSVTTKCSVVGTGAYMAQWVSTFSIVFTSDNPHPGQMLSVDDWTVSIDGHDHDSKYKGDGYYVGYKGIKSIDYLGSNKYRMMFNHFPHAYCSSQPCDGQTGSRVSLFNRRYNVSSAEVVMKADHFADITAISALGAKSASGDTMVSFTVSFKSSEPHADIMSGAKVYVVAFNGDQFTVQTPIALTKISLAYDTGTGAYTFIGTATNVGKNYSGGYAYAYVSIEPTGGTVTTGIYKDVKWTYEDLPKIVVALTGVTANTTVTPNATTPMDGFTFSWDWGDGNVETGLTASPAAHTYASAGNYTVTVEGGISAIAGDQSLPWTNPWLRGAKDFITAVTISGDITLGIRAFYGCSHLASVTADGVSSIGQIAFCGAAPEPIGSASFHSATNVERSAFEGAAYVIDLTSATSIAINALRFVLPESEVTIGKTKAEVRAMTNYPFGMIGGNLINCTDGYINI